MISIAKSKLFPNSSFFIEKCCHGKGHGILFHFLGEINHRLIQNDL